MPETTPIYSFPYPCPGETINATTFAALANAIDTKLADVELDRDLALNRYNTLADMFPAQGGIVAGVETPLVNSGSSYVIPAAGIYIAAVEQNSAVATTINWSRTRIRRNGVAVAGKTANWEVSVPNILGYDVGGVALVCAVGDTIDVTFLFAGTGTATVNIRLDVRMIVRLA